MGYYDMFVKEATEGYAKLPEEASELYKRHHSVIGALGSLSSNEQAEGSEIQEFLKTNNGRMGMEFDAVIGSSTTILNNRNVEAARPQDSEDLLEKMMHNNIDDKYAAFINAYSKRAISINVPAGESREIKLLFLNHDQPLLSHVFMNAERGAKAKVVEIYASLSTKPSAMATIHEITSGNDSNFELDAIHNENFWHYPAVVLQEQHRQQRKPQVQHLLQRHRPEQGAKRHECDFQDEPYRGE